MKRQANDVSVLLIGGPDAGKSNFLFRVWMAIDSQTGILRSDGVPNDLEYLREGAEQLLGGGFAAKTSIEVHNQSIIPVKYSNNGDTFSGTLAVPDCPGEQWLGIYKKRQWSDVWEKLISKNCGCLLFVRADSTQVVAPLDWISYHKLFGATLNPPTKESLHSTTENAETPTQSAHPSAIVPTEFAGDAEITHPIAEVPSEQIAPPTQVVMVDWLQCLKRAFTAKAGGRFRPRVGIIVAAWDCIPADQQKESPASWLNSNFPMLGQFIEANQDYFNFEVFGVSIVGGDLKSDPDFRKEYCSGDPNKAGYVVFGDGDSGQEHPDLTLPIAWAMGLEKQTFANIPKA